MPAAKRWDLHNENVNEGGIRREKLVHVDDDDKCDGNEEHDNENDWNNGFLIPRRHSPSHMRVVYYGFLDVLPNEILHHILTHLDVPDILATSRVNHHLRNLSLHPHLHRFRLHINRLLLPPLLTYRSSLASLIARSIFLTPNTLVSRRLGRSLVSISLSRKLDRRPTPIQLVERAVLPPECVPGCSGMVAPGLVARRREVERERMKDALRRWIGDRWRGEVDRRGEGVKREDGRKGVGRVWRLKRFWERVSRGEMAVGGRR